MKIKDLLHETSGALLSNKVRSSLTMLGIIIGIASVIAMLAIGQGAQNSVQSSIESIGSNLIIVMPGASGGSGFRVSTGRGSAQTLTDDDATAISSMVSGVEAVSPELSSRFQVVYKGNNTNTQITGVLPAYADVRNVQISEGSFITDSQQQSSAKVAVLGPTVVSDIFATGTDPIGKTIRINSMNFTVIGVTVSKGGSGFNNQDDVIYIPLSTQQRFLVGFSSQGKAYVSTVYVQADSQSDMTQVQNEISTLLLERHKISDPGAADFSTLNQADIVQTASSVTSVFTYLLASVASISLIVGGIGIMNMMLTTVTERTREIGLRKAIGARKQDINTQFLVESIMLTFTGGLVGILLGWFISFVVTATGLISAAVSLNSVLLAFGVSALIGIVFGYYPARRAANLNPIEALRYE